MNTTGAGLWFTQTYIVPHLSTPWMVILVLSFITIVLTEAMSNAAVVAVLVPIGMSIARQFGMDPKVVKILHDAFRGALDDPEFVKVMDRLDQVTSYLGTEDYTRWAREQYAVEKVVVEKLGLKQ